jgi:hypothetical protein
MVPSRLRRVQGNGRDPSRDQSKLERTHSHRPQSAPNRPSGSLGLNASQTAQGLAPIPPEGRAGSELRAAFPGWAAGIADAIPRRARKRRAARTRGGTELASALAGPCGAGSQSPAANKGARKRHKANPTRTARTPLLHATARTHPRIKLNEQPTTATAIPTSCLTKQTRR